MGPDAGDVRNLRRKDGAPQFSRTPPGTLQPGRLKRYPSNTVLIYLKRIQSQGKLRNALSDAWDATGRQTSTGKPIDGILCPVSPLAGYPHDFLPYWGYTSLFNLVDYPSTVIPVKYIKVKGRDDPKGPSYKPQSNAFDANNYEICRCHPAYG